MVKEKLDPEQQRLHREALERWMLAEREVHLYNTACRAFVEDGLFMPPDIETVVMKREHIVRFRAAYELAICALADLVGKTPQEMTQFDAINVLLRKHYAGGWPERVQTEVEAER